MLFYQLIVLCLAASQMIMHVTESACDDHGGEFKLAMRTAFARHSLLTL